ncbi:MAG: hypothetical protein IH940_07085 [Acidobacteria bacterium]|nr:hypothetical protein [Acidobacteriota bacterium]
MRVLIVGQPKSGTTALMTAVVKGLESTGVEVATLFEPGNLLVQDLDVAPLVAKKLLVGLGPNEHAAFYAFDKRVLLMRDPRDRLISVMLYDIYGRPEALSDGVQRWLDALRRKEADPGSVGVLDLLYTYWELTDVNLLQWFANTLVSEQRFFNTRADRFHVVRYEDLVTGNIAALCEYLGFAIEASPEISGPEARVTRSRAAGEWRQWVLPSDLLVLRPLMQQTMKRLGFTDMSWAVDSQPALDPALGSEYVAGLLQRRKEAEPIEQPAD